MLTMRENFLAIVVASAFVCAFFNHVTVESLAAEPLVVETQQTPAPIVVEFAEADQPSPWATLARALTL